ncbi:nucleoside hydrolase [Paenibacillus sp. MWE-103]|uniref:Nucleoside hydrolase n=1 Tax=Paenibacillus artemisiicola TaxID=1172618 RepID=A0ABS3W3C2_9BACL|nr:nucleoside hydrolase [Paenibacillus artemisiicola]MBO7742806.1 nucleoside hydrolase [Paenibacillus artemisiicola]
MAIPKFIIDADTGIDDALAILYGLKSDKADIVGITTGFGNIPVEQATDNTLRIVKLAGFEHLVPVSMGAARPLVRHPEFATRVHGRNGIGDVELPPSSQRPAEEPADAFIVRMAGELGGELSLVTLGRLTNVAHALRRDPGLPAKIKHVYVMGGAVRVPGNVTPVAEANIWGDPDAADLVFRSGLAVTMIGLDVTLRTRLHQHQLDALRLHCKPENREVVDFIDRSMQAYFRFYGESNGFDACAPLHDPLTMLAAVEPGIVHTETLRLSVECEGKHCLGMTVADLRHRAAVGHPVRVGVEVDAASAVEKLLAVF